MYVYMICVICVCMLCSKCCAQRTASSLDFYLESGSLVTAVHSRLLRLRAPRHPPVSHPDRNVRDYKQPSASGFSEGSEHQSSGPPAW